MTAPLDIPALLAEAERRWYADGGLDCKYTGISTRTCRTLDARIDWCRACLDKELLVAFRALASTQREAAVQRLMPSAVEAFADHEKARADVAESALATLRAEHARLQADFERMERIAKMCGGNADKRTSQLFEALAEVERLKAELAEEKARRHEQHSIACDLNSDVVYQRKRVEAAEAQVMRLRAGIETALDGLLGTHGFAAHDTAKIDAIYKALTDLLQPAALSGTPEPTP